MKKQAESIAKAMHASNVRRLIFISSMGIYQHRVDPNVPMGGSVPVSMSEGVASARGEAADTTAESDVQFMQGPEDDA